MPVLDTKTELAIPNGVTGARLSLTGSGNKARVNVRDDGSKEVIKHAVLEGAAKKTLKWSAPPAGIDYELYNTGPADINVTWL
ncbi:hypothetical protein [Methylobacterium nodulans]|uniref:hypothetical protein n=1 Tax=Methylobacterium nodulans TaxID=114616 RepID=UPI0012ED5492|nr:hypothetical protein [Methylobacterium nodulans]